MDTYQAVEVAIENAPPRYVVRLTGFTGWGKPPICDCGETSPESKANAERIARSLNAVSAMPAVVAALDRVECAADTAAHFLRRTAPDEAARFRADARLARRAIEQWESVAGRQV